MRTGGPALALLALVLQSGGEVLYGTFLTDVPVPLFILLCMGQATLVCLAIARFRMPARGRGLLLQANLWTAVCFVSVFFSLRSLPPVVCTSIEIALSLAMALALTAMQKRAWPRPTRLVACAGIVAGCGLLSWTEMRALAPDASPLQVWGAIASSTATGIGGAFLVNGFKRLGDLGWSPAAALGHRFYLTIAAGGLWLLLDPPATAVPSGGALAAIALIGAIAVLLPLLLFQLAVRRTDELTLLICMAAQPLISFSVMLPSPAYGWSLPTLAGVLLVTAFVAFDLAGQQRQALGQRLRRYWPSQPAV